MTHQIQQYFGLMKNIEENLLTYINENNQDNNFFNYLDEQKVTENKQIFKSFLYLLVNVSNNYHRTKDFYLKIDQILTKYNTSIQTYFKNSEIFHIFQSNKRILLILIQQKLFAINQEIIDFFNQKKFRQKSYIEYFFPEIESFLPESVKNECKNNVKELNENNFEIFNKKRKMGENDSYICSLIRNDQVVDFITYLERTNTSPTAMIEKSIYETNHFLLKNNEELSLIYYSAYFGAQQIFVYLFQRYDTLEPSIWTYTVHGKNPDLIHFLEEYHIATYKDSYQYLVIEAIKCHHYEIANYFEMNFCDKEQIYEQYLLKKSLKYYNFMMENCNDQQIIQFSYKSDLFFFLCKYNYALIVEDLLSINVIDINQQYKIYKPISNPKDIVLSIAIKNGEIEKIPKHRKHIESKDHEYKEGSSYYTYNYNQDMITALHIATRKGNIDIIQLLLHNTKIDFKIQSRIYYKSLYSSNFKEFFTILEKRSLLHEAIESGYVDAAQIVASLNKFNFHDNLIISEEFIDSCSTAHMHLINENHKTLLMLAAELGYSEIMRFLILQKRQNINEKSLYFEYREGGCLNYEIKRKKTEKTPLHIAIQKGNYNLVKFCLEQPKIDINNPFVVFDIDEPNHRGFLNFFKHKSVKMVINMPPICMAVLNGNIDIVSLLLNQPKVNINLESALKLAVQNKQIEIVKLLLQKKEINKDALDENNVKPIEYADDEKIKEFLKNK